MERKNGYIRLSNNQERRWLGFPPLDDSSKDEWHKERAIASAAENVLGAMIDFIAFHEELIESGDCQEIEEVRGIIAQATLHKDWLTDTVMDIETSNLDDELDNLGRQD